MITDSDSWKFEVGPSSEGRVLRAEWAGRYIDIHLRSDIGLGNQHRRLDVKVKQLLNYQIATSCGCHQGVDRTYIHGVNQVMPLRDRSRSTMGLNSEQIYSILEKIYG